VGCFGGGFHTIPDLSVSRRYPGAVVWCLLAQSPNFFFNIILYSTPKVNVFFIFLALGYIYFEAMYLIWETVGGYLFV
jgi:hypothetical protein